MTLAAGATFPSLLLPRVGGGSLRLPRGPALILFFRDSEASAPAAAALAHLAETLVPGGLTVVGVSEDDPGGAAAFATEHGLGAIDLCHDGATYQAAAAVGLSRLPTVFLVDGGEVIQAVEGWNRRDYNNLAARAAGLLGTPVPIASHPGDGLPESLDPEPGPTA